MGFDYEKGKFTSDNHEMLSSQTFSLLRELKKGESCIVEADEVWVDRSPERTTWVNANAIAYSDNQFISMGRTDPEEFTRIHVVKQGYVMDSSHLDKKHWASEDLFARFECIGDTNLYEEPIIFCVFNVEELEIVKPALEKAKIQFHKLNPIPDLIRAIEDVPELEEEYSTDEGEDSAED